MVYYYLDIETYSTGERPDPKTDRIITVLICALDPKGGKPVQEPILLKSWESNEAALVEHLARRMLHGKPFDFVAVGFNILFDLWFLKEKFRQHGQADFGDRFFMDRPYLDLKHVAILANEGRFKGAKLGGEGNPIREWYENGEWGEIERYTLQKLERFIEAYGIWAERLQG